MFIESHMKKSSALDSFQNPGCEIFYIYKVNWFTKKYNANYKVCKISECSVQS